MSIHRKVWINAGFAFAAMFVTYAAPAIPDWKAAATVQMVSHALFIGFIWAFLASLAYYESGIIESA